MRGLWAVIKRTLSFAFAVVLAYQAYLFVQVWQLRTQNPTDTAFLSAERARLRQLGVAQEIHPIWVSQDRISRYLKRAVIAAEDTGFVKHHGIDWDAIERAFRTNQSSGEIRLGGSTITMQLAKNLFLSAERSYWRKAQEMVIATMLEAVLDKRRILEIYLNVVEWGEGVFGAQAAAQHYYGVDAARLNPWQSAWLASILPAPRRYENDRSSDWIVRKTDIILKRMPQVDLPPSF